MQWFVSVNWDFQAYSYLYSEIIMGFDYIDKCDLQVLNWSLNSYEDSIWTWLLQSWLIRLQTQYIHHHSIVQVAIVIELQYIHFYSRGKPLRKELKSSLDIIQTVWGACCAGELGSVNGSLLPYGELLVRGRYSRLGWLDLALTSNYNPPTSQPASCFPQHRQHSNIIMSITLRLYRLYVCRLIPYSNIYQPGPTRLRDTNTQKEKWLVYFSPW